VNHINKPTRYAANLQTPKTPDSVIAHRQLNKVQFSCTLRYTFAYQKMDIVGFSCACSNQ